MNCLVYAIHSSYIEENPNKVTKRTTENRRKESKVREIKALRRWISWVDNESIGKQKISSLQINRNEIIVKVKEKVRRKVC